MINMAIEYEKIYLAMEDADDMDKALNNNYPWHGKWYVDTMTSDAKLFDTQKEAKQYLVKIRKHIYDTRQLR